MYAYLKVGYKRLFEYDTINQVLSNLCSIVILLNCISLYLLLRLVIFALYAILMVRQFSARPTQSDKWHAMALSLTYTILWQQNEFQQLPHKIPSTYIRS